MIAVIGLLTAPLEYFDLVLMCISKLYITKKITNAEWQFDMQACDRKQGVNKHWP